MHGYRAGRLVFAGEASATDGEAGTVGGAISTGERTAAEVRTLLGVQEDHAYRCFSGNSRRGWMGGIPS